MKPDPIRFQAICIAITLLFAGCASDHDLKRDGMNVLGGDFIDDEIRPGLYSIKAFSNMSPFPTLGSARATFEKRANALCGAGGYTLVNSNLKSYESSAPTVPPPRVSFMAGHVLCVGSSVTLDEARKILSLE